MKLHSPEELENLLRQAINAKASSLGFVIREVKASQSFAGWVTITFVLGDLLVKMERDRGAIDLFINGPDDVWHDLTGLHAFWGQNSKNPPRVKSKELFDPGYTEDGAIFEVVSGLAGIYSEIKAVLTSPDAYSNFVAFENRRLMAIRAGL